VPGSAAGTVKIMDAGPVNCGGHTAQICEQCPQGNGAAWCNGDCTWSDARQTCEGHTGKGLAILGSNDDPASGTQLILSSARPADWKW